ncbi:MAG TPA: response regulator [Telmatospirillum sp.]|nr:response regulator [Telmatospirillum sp.]
MACILIIEDNAANMKLVVVLLEKEGYEVLQATDAEDGIRLTRERHPDLILMDVQLPRMDGLTATRLLKGDLATRDIRIVALTAFAMPGDHERIAAAGCDGYITKPIHYRDFLNTVAAELGKGTAKR